MAVSDLEVIDFIHREEFLLGSFEIFDSPDGVIHDRQYAK